MKKVKIVRKSEARNFMEGAEHCRLYVDTDTIVFGVSTLPPGTKGDVDLGHESSKEVFLVMKGKVLVHLTDEKVYEELNEGDAILIPPPRPHELINIGESTAIVVWSQAKIQKEG